jgi:hypothetical protein
MTAPTLTGEYTATYSPDDNKLRLYAATRLDPDTYARVKAAGFAWAPKQELFVAPAWTPEREDLLIELAGEIDDDDTSLCDRAADRAERFEDYSEKRAADAESARQAVDAIAGAIPLGQPILVGHHSERRARKDAERIQRGVERAVKLWRTSEYWTQRARGAIRHAKYKERADVRARRIKKLEADLRRMQKLQREAAGGVRAWERLATWERKDGTPTTLLEKALFLANYDSHVYGTWSDLTSGKITPEDAQTRAIGIHTAAGERAARWIEHLTHRLDYERAMLADAGGTVADKTGPEVGGGCKSWVGWRGEWRYITKVNKVSVTVLDNWGNGGANFRRTIPFDKLSGVMTRAEVERAKAEGRLTPTPDGTGFHIHESAPTPSAPETTPAPSAPTPNADAFRALEKTLKAGVQVVSAPQLFPTPPDVARRLVRLATSTTAGMRVLEPSAGTGNLVRAVFDSATGADCVRLVAVERNAALAEGLREQQRRTLYATPDNFAVHCADFLTLTPADLGTFDLVVMNPPFEDASDIKHIRHARTFLKPNGVLVAICARGPRQVAALQPEAEHWEELPADTFAGTSVNAAILTMRAE